MALVRKEFSITETEARNLSRLGEMRVSGFEVTPSDVTPFDVLWPETVLSVKEWSRFRLPSLMFDGRLVAGLGYRNKNGFLLLLPGLPEQVENAIAARFRRMTDIARVATRSYDEQMRHLTREANDLLHQFSPNDQKRGLSQPFHNSNDLINLVCGKLSSHPGVRFALGKNPDNRSGRMTVSMSANDGPGMIEIFNISWKHSHYRQPWDNPHREDVVISSGPLMDRQVVNKFINNCFYEHESQYDNGLFKGNPLNEQDNDRITNAVSKADLGYY